MDKCNGVECANGQIGFGKKKKKRDVSDKSAVQQKIYEVSMSTIVKVSDDPDDIGDKKTRKESVFVEKATLREIYHGDDLAIARLSEEFGPARYVDFQADYETNRSAKTTSTCIVAVFLAVVNLLRLL